MKQTIVFILFAFVLSPVASAKLKIVTTTEDSASIAQLIGGNEIDVTSLTPGTRDPHFAEAKPSMIRHVSRADLLIVIGADLEIGWLPALLQSSRNASVLPDGKGYLDLSQHVEIKGKPQTEVTRAMGDVHAKGNPHYWLDPMNGLRMAAAIKTRLVELDGKHAESYENNYNDFRTKLENKLTEWKSMLSHLQHKPVLTYHTSLLYLADAFGFRIADYIEPKPGIAPGASHLNGLIKRIKTEEIKLLIMEPFYEQRSAEFLRKQTGIGIAVIPQSVRATNEARDYFSLFDSIVQILR